MRIEEISGSKGNWLSLSLLKNPGITGTDNYNVEVIEGYLAHKWNLEATYPLNIHLKLAPTTNVSYTFSAKLYLDPNGVPMGHTNQFESRSVC